MTDPQALYAAKRVAAREAADSIVDGSNLILGMGVAMPPAFMAALAERARERRGLSNLPVYAMHSNAAAAETILKPDLMDVLHPHSLFMSPHDRALQLEGRRRGQTWVRFVPCLFHQVGRLLSERISPDCFVTTVSPMDRSGHFSLGTNADYGADIVRTAKRVIVEVNPHMPRTFGETHVHVRDVDLVIEHAAPLMEVAEHTATDEDRTIARRIVDHIPDGATLQMGVGGVPSAVMAALGGHRDLGLHSELLSPPMARLIRSGVITGRAKSVMAHKHVFTLALGDAAMYDFMNDNPAIVGHPATWVNSPAVIRKQSAMISVNAAIQIDLTGQINSESLDGHQFSGTGGQLDFVRGAYLAPGGKSFVALRSTAKSGTVSRIVPRLTDAAVTDPRVDAHWVVTEFGMVDLKGLSLGERAAAMIGIAHPDFRAELSDAARSMSLF
jgi:itaconate CoA-transferase